MVVEALLLCTSVPAAFFPWQEGHLSLLLALFLSLSPLPPRPPASFKKQTLCCSLHLLGSSVLVYLGNILMIERPTHHFFFFCKIQNKGMELEKVKTTLWVVYAQRKSELEPELGSP